jgi:hypothetical protein
LPFTALLAPAAHAEPHGVVVRLDAAGVALPKVSVTLTPAAGAPTEITLLDDGNAPDVTAGDYTWSGSSWLEGDDFAVTVLFGDKTLDGGKVSWAPTDSARDLSIGVSGDAVTAEATVSGSNGTPSAGPGTGDPSSLALGGAQTAPAAAAPGAAQAAPVAGGMPVGPGGGTMVGMPVSAPATSSHDGSLYIGFGVGVLVLVGVVWLWLRNRQADGDRRAGNLVVVAEPGLLGEGTPSLSDGLSVWVVDPADADALLRPLAATLARHHRVLFVAPARAAAPSVHGGPVYRAPSVRPSSVGDTAEALQNDVGGAVAVLIAGAEPDVALHRDYADLLPSGIGCISILRADPGLPAVERVVARRDGPVWVLQTKDRTLRLVEGPAGFEAEATP